MMRKSTFIVLFLVCISLTFALPVDSELVQRAAGGWLLKNTTPMNTVMSQEISSVNPFYSDGGQVLYYVVGLNPSGFVIFSANDRVEPVIAFSSSGIYDSNENNPLTILLKEDMQTRLEQIETKAFSASSAAGADILSPPQQKWQTLVDSGNVASGESLIQPMGVSTVSDVRVPPLMMTLWDQGNADGGYCYNYYTPNHYVTGCVATAMAQVFRYHSWPTAGIGRHSYTVYVNGSPQTAYTLGGDEAGGSYNWSQMPYDPDVPVLTDTQRQAIGALCADAGTSVGMSYTSSASSASLYNGDERITDRFLYSNSIYGSGFSSSGDAQLWTMINSNLNADLPVIMGISRTGGGHAVVVDGYGYNSSTLYHHCNLGWGGYQNSWYNLPVIDAGSYTYTALDDLIYNIYTSGSGEIISGRVISLAGVPLENVNMTAYQGATPVMQVSTNSRGIFAFKGVSSNTQYRISAVKSGYAFTDQYVTTGISNDSSSVTGNKWDIDFVSTNAQPPTAFDIQEQVHSTQSVTIDLEAVDDHLPDPPDILTYIITSLPRHGFLSEPGVGPINTVPYAMTPGFIQVEYTPCPYYGGDDTFTYKANDDGTPSTGGDSNIATVTVTVDNQLNADYATDSFNWVYGVIILDTTFFYDSKMQVIYRQADIGDTIKITDLAMRIGQLPSRTLNNWTIRMQHTDWDEFTNPSSQYLATGWTQVHRSNVTITETEWINFHFDQPFTYNGTQNLLIDFTFNNTGITSGQQGGYYYNTAVTADRVISLGSSTGGHGDPLTWNSTSGKYTNITKTSVPSMKLIGTVPIDPITGDFNRSCVVDLPDIGIFSAAWASQQGEPNYDDICDIATPKNNAIDTADLAELCLNWLQVYP